MHFQSAARTDVGLKRKANQDAVLDRSDIGFWAVADGMGGAEDGELASAMIVQAFEGLGAASSVEELGARAATELEKVNAEIFAIARSGPRQKTIGSTAVTLAIGDGNYDVMWVGDSRAYLLRDREIRRLTEDHSLVQKLIRARLISPEEAEGHPDANVITRAIGVSHEVEIDRVGGKALAGDIFLLASDGLTRVVPDEEIGKVLATRNPMQAADVLLNTVLDRGAPDNVSIVIVRVG